MQILVLELVVSLWHAQMPSDLRYRQKAHVVCSRSGCAGWSQNEIQPGLATETSCPVVIGCDKLHPSTSKSLCLIQVDLLLLRFSLGYRDGDPLGYS
jgi:hypothetical protein